MAAEDQTYTLEDLAEWRRPGTWLAVIGDPIGHSLSPAMHNAALAKLRDAEPDFGDWRYVRFRIPADRLSEALPAFHTARFRGLNLTIPHKVRAFDLVAEVDPEARVLGAVNTLIWSPQGYTGTNTDGFGIARAVEQAFGERLGDSEVVLLGAGGAARSVAVQALRDGARRVWIGNRSRERLDELLAVLDEGGFAKRVTPFLFAQAPSELPKTALIINATAAGLHPEDPLPFPLDGFAAESRFYDTTYGARNAWAEACAERGIAYCDGLPMLVWQGARSLELWTGRTISAEVMEAAARDALASR